MSSLESETLSPPQCGNLFPDSCQRAVRQPDTLIADEALEMVDVMLHSKSQFAATNSMLFDIPTGEAIRPQTAALRVEFGIEHLAPKGQRTGSTLVFVKHRSIITVAGVQ